MGLSVCPRPTPRDLDRASARTRAVSYRHLPRGRVEVVTTNSARARRVIEALTWAPSRVQVVVTVEQLGEHGRRTIIGAAPAGVALGAVATDGVPLTYRPTPTFQETAA